MSTRWTVFWYLSEHEQRRGDVVSDDSVANWRSVFHRRVLIDLPNMLVFITGDKTICICWKD